MDRTRTTHAAADDEAGLVSGRWAILAVVVVALAGSVGGFWYHASLQRRPLAFWGTATARLILQAPKVDALWLAPTLASAAAEGDETLARGDERWAIVEVADISRAPGLSHLRQALVHDRSFVWNDAARRAVPRWDRALRFGEGANVAVVYLDTASGQIGAQDATRELNADTLAGLKSFFDTHAANATPDAKPPEAGQGGE